MLKPRAGCWVVATCVVCRYPAEAEILMPPCTALQAVETIIEKDLVIVAFR